MNMFKITVPASSANIGPGFDSAGMAINRYLTLHVSKHDQWEFKHDSPFLPKHKKNKDHFIYRVAKQICQKHDQQMPPCKVIIKSDIPLARGLGSSASAVIAGIELANQLCELALSNLQKLQYATEAEGHPDNVSPALFGGLTVTTQFNKDHVEYIQLPNLDLDIVLYIPDVELRTKDSRNVLPTEFSREYATSGSGISNVMIASFLTKNYKQAGKMMEQDIYHEPYRAKLIPNYQFIRKKAKEFGAFGTVISGAGPTMISFVPVGEGVSVASQMKTLLPHYDIDAAKIDYSGLKVE